MSGNMTEQARRNLSPHKAARYAVYIWGERYSKQGGGTMDFWDKLTERERQFCRECVAEILASPDEP